MTRVLKALLTTVILALGIGFASTPAVASANSVLSPTECTNFGAWHSPTGNWGQIRWCYKIDPVDDRLWFQVQVDDTATDGYQVHVEWFTASHPFWHDLESLGCTIVTVASSGPVVTGCWSEDGQSVPWVGAYNFYLRVVQGRGDSPGPHQFIAYGTYCVLC